jgi:hypothetical protein
VLSLSSACTKTDADDCAMASASSDCKASGGGTGATAPEQDLGALGGDERLDGETLGGQSSRIYCFEATTNSVLHVALTEPNAVLTTKLYPAIRTAAQPKPYFELSGAVADAGVRHPVKAGNYCLELTNGSGAPATYTLLVSLEAYASPEPAELPGNARKSASGLQVSEEVLSLGGYVDEEEGADYYRLEMSSAFELELTLDQVVGGVTMEVLPEQESIQQPSISTLSRFNDADITPLAERLSAGTYFLKVLPFVTDSGSATAASRRNLYTLAVSAKVWDEKFEVQPDPGETAAAAVELTATVSGYVDRADDPADYYRFTLPTAASVSSKNVAAVSGAVSVTFRPADSNEATATAQIDSGINMAGPSPDKELPAGDYLIKVEPLKTDSGSALAATKRNLYTLHFDFLE